LRGVRGSARRVTSKRLAPIRTVSKPRGFRAKTYDLSLWDALASQGQGTTKLERAVDAVARRMGIAFDAYQYTVHLTTLTATRIDMVILYPKRIAVFADGIMHEIRPDTAQQDAVRRAELEAMGWGVIAIKESDFIRDPEGEVGKILNA